MSLPSSLLTGLLSFWPFSEGSGAVAADVISGYDMDLAGDARGVNGIDGLWANTGAMPAFAGGGAATIAGQNFLQNIGDKITLGVEHWFGGYAETIDPWPSVASGPSSQTVAQVDGDNSFLYFLAYGAVDPPPSDPATDTNCYVGSGVGTGNGVDTFVEAPPFTTWTGAQPYVLLLEMERTGTTEITTRLFVRDAQNMNSATQVIAYTGDPWTFTAGDTELHPGTVRRAALWARGLTDDEKHAIFGDDSLEGLGDPLDEQDPFLDVDGANALPFRDICALTVGARHIESDGEQRHSRQVHERMKRKYSLLLENVAPDVMARVEQGISLGRGCQPLRWRHPTDDAPGPRSTAPRWLLVNAANIAIERTVAGSGGNITLEMQEV